MKKIILILLITFTFNVNAQTETPNTDSQMKETLLEYFKEAVITSKGTLNSTLQLAEKTVTVVLEQSTIVVKQFIIYTSIKYAIPLILSLIITIYLPKKIKDIFTISNSVVASYKTDRNKEIDEYKKDKKKFYYIKGYFYNSRLFYIISKATTTLPYIVTIYIFYLNFMPWIKITFFSKLYLVEMLMKLI